MVVRTGFANCPGRWIARWFFIHCSHPKDNYFYSLGLGKLHSVFHVCSVWRRPGALHDSQVNGVVREMCVHASAHLVRSCPRSAGRWSGPPGSSSRQRRFSAQRNSSRRSRPSQWPKSRRAHHPVQQPARARGGQPGLPRAAAKPNTDFMRKTASGYRKNNRTSPILSQNLCHIKRYM